MHNFLVLRKRGLIWTKSFCCSWYHIKLLLCISLSCASYVQKSKQLQYLSCRVI
jgi:hypothetical protein